MVHIENGRDHFWQWDLDQRLIVDDPTVEEVHFCNAMSESALVCEVREENGVRYVNVPNILLQSALCISAYSHCDGYTVVNQRFNVIERTRPDDYVYTETQVMRWQDLEQRVKDGVGYYVPNVDADGNLSWTSDNPLLPSVETVNVKGTKGDPGEVTESQLAAAIAPLNVAGSVQAKRISNLEAAAQGILYREDVDTTEAYAKAVPAGAMPWASLDKVGGKTVVWNQLQKNSVSRSTAGITFSYENGTLTAAADGNARGIAWWLTSTAAKIIFKANHKYAILGIFPYDRESSTGWYIASSPQFNLYDGDGIYTVSADSETYLQLMISAKYDMSSPIVCKPQIFDLTQMFGAGNEPSTVEEFRAMFPADYYPYNPGELMSAEVVEVESRGKNLQIVDAFPITDEVRDMCPGYGWSAGTVCNEIDFERKVYVQRVGKADADSVTWHLGSTTTNENGVGFLEANVLNVTNLSQDASRYLISNIKLGTGLWGTATEDEFWLNAETLFFRFKTSKTSGITLADGLARMRELGAVCYYPLPDPIEVDLSGVLPDDNFIEVESGGTVTFKQASTQLPVPSAVTYQISTKEAIANA